MSKYSFNLRNKLQDAVDYKEEFENEYHEFT